MGILYNLAACCRPKAPLWEGGAVVQAGPGGQAARHQCGAPAYAEEPGMGRRRQRWRRRWPARRARHRLRAPAGGGAGTIRVDVVSAWPWHAAGLPLPGSAGLRPWACAALPLPVEAGAGRSCWRSPAGCVVRPRGGVGSCGLRPHRTCPASREKPRVPAVSACRPHHQPGIRGVGTHRVTNSLSQVGDRALRAAGGTGGLA